MFSFLLFGAPHKSVKVKVGSFNYSTVRIIKAKIIER